jgi:hypothetical protein
MHFTYQYQYIISTHRGHGIAYLVEGLCYRPEVAGSRPEEVKELFQFT